MIVMSDRRHKVAKMWCLATDSLVCSFMVHSQYIVISCNIWFSIFISKFCGHDVSWICVGVPLVYFCALDYIIVIISYILLWFHNSVSVFLVITITSFNADVLNFFLRGM